MYQAGEAVAAAADEGAPRLGDGFLKVAESAGGYGAKIDHPDALPDALQQCAAGSLARVVRPCCTPA